MAQDTKDQVKLLTHDGDNDTHFAVLFGLKTADERLVEAAAGLADDAWEE